MKQRLIRAGKWLLVTGLIGSVCLLGSYPIIVAATREHMRITVIPMSCFDNSYH